MKYKIYSGKIMIAQFLHESDRDFCLDALLEEYPDAQFSTEEN